MIEAAIAFAIRVLSAGLVFALQVLLARLMPIEAYGGFVTIWTWMLALGSFAALGFAESSVRFLPRYRARGREADVQGFWRFGLKLVIAGACVAAVVGIGGGMLLAGDDLRLMVVLVAAGLPFLAMEYYLEGIARSLGWYRLTTVPVYIVRPLLIGGMAAGLAAMGVTLTLAVVGAVVIGSMALVALGLAIVLVWRLRTDMVMPPASPGQRALWLRASLPLLLVSGLEDLLLYVDVLVLSLVARPEDVATYFAAARVLALANFVTFALYLVAGRRFALDLAERDREKLQASVLAMSGLTFWATLVAVGATAIAGTVLLAAFGDGFGAGWPVIVILGLGMVVRSLSGQAGELLVVTGRQRETIAVGAGALGLNLALSFALVGPLGIFGVALATALAMAARALVLVVVLQRVEGIRVVSVGVPLPRRHPGESRGPS